jgi:hypothetical protein
MNKAVYILVLIVASIFSGVVNATDIVLSNTLPPIIVKVERLALIPARNEAVAYVKIAGIPLSPYKETTPDEPSNIYVRINLDYVSGTQMYNDFQRAMRSGINIVLRVYIYPYATLVVKDTNGQNIERFLYWTPISAWLRE